MSIGTEDLQLDLFGEVQAQDQADREARAIAAVAASAFIVGTPWPDLLAWWLHSEIIESGLDHGQTKASYRRGPNETPGWAWAIWRDGLRFESDETWQGWSHRPRWCIPWSELHALRDARQDVTERLQVLADGRGHPRSVGWRWWIDPLALRPDGTHPSNLEGEKAWALEDGLARPESAHSDRLEAWRLVVDVVRDAHLSPFRVTA